MENENIMNWMRKGHGFSFLEEEIAWEIRVNAH